MLPLSLAGCLILKCSTVEGDRRINDFVACNEMEKRLALLWGYTVYIHSYEVDRKKVSEIVFF